MADALSILSINSNQENTQKSTYKRGILSEVNDTEELHGGIFLINLKLIDQYQRKDPSLNAKYKMGAYKKGYFRGGSHININLVTCEGNIVIQSILQSYVLYWYYKYLLRPVMGRTDVVILQHF